ncbi:Txe/YoeB family addiction module toxin [Candidatus Kapabacteria bacterium]|nr:Txe/YoeB family addiction module toxin [Candidatus Kapabacteria bacterium]
MAYLIDFSEKSLKDIEFHKKSGNKSALNKVLIFLTELVTNPFEGTGKPEALKHQLTGRWSRRIDKEHRLVYRVEGNFVYILSAKGHY